MRRGGEAGEDNREKKNCMMCEFHCKKLLLIYSKSDCKITVVFAVGKYTTMITVK